MFYRAILRYHPVAVYIRYILMISKYTLLLIKMTLPFIKQLQKLCISFELQYTCFTMRKPDSCICENKGADSAQRGAYRTADQHICFRYKYSTITLLPKSEISSFQPSSMTVQPVCVGNPEVRFSHDAAHSFSGIFSWQINLLVVKDNDICFTSDH